MQNVFQDEFVEQIQLRLVAKETGLVDGQVLEQAGQFLLAVIADQQPVVAIEGVQLAFPQAAQQAVLQKMRAALIEMHAAFLVYERLQQPQFGIRQWWRYGGCAHVVVRLVGRRLLPSPRRIFPRVSSRSVAGACSCPEARSGGSCTSPIRWSNSAHPPAVLLAAVLPPLSE